MRCSWILCLLLLGTAFAQVVPPPRSPQPKPAVADDDDDDDDAQSTPMAARSTLSPETPVISIKGICDQKAYRPASVAKAGTIGVGPKCETLITRAEFERLADALEPDMPSSKRQQLGAAYSQFLVMAHEARKRDLDKGEHFEEMMEFARLQVLTQELNRALQEEATKVSDKDVADYYRRNNAMFEQATLQRIFVPLTRQGEQARNMSQSESKKAELEARDAMKHEADSLCARAIAGEGFEQLQKEAFTMAGVKGNSPSTNMETVRRSNLPIAHATVFELKPGEVSQVISDLTGHYVYKMVSRDVLPLEQVKDEISQALQRLHMGELTQSIHNSSTVELNDAYFAPATAAPASGATSKTGTDIDEPRNASLAERR